MKNARRIALVISALLLLSSVIVPALHHHFSETAEAQIDCRACAWTRTTVSGIFTTLASIIPLGLVFFTPRVIELPDSPCLDPIRAIRGPPALSA
ncbi:MAG: hypothetical protein ACE5FC_11925 [Myxococcota bacterium]